MSSFNLICISFNIVSVGVTNWIFDFAAFIGIIKGYSKDLEDDDDDDKVGEKLEGKVDFDVSSIFLRGWKKTKFENFLLYVDLNVEENDLYNLIVVELV